MGGAVFIAPACLVSHVIIFVTIVINYCVELTLCITLSISKLNVCTIKVIIFLQHY